jgi:hypothetical protein
MALLCTQEELDEMCRNGTELVHEAIDSGDPAVARAEWDRIVEARTGLVDLMIDWGATAIRWVLENHGPEEMAKCFEPDLLAGDRAAGRDRGRRDGGSGA